MFISVLYLISVGILLGFSTNLVKVAVGAGWDPVSFLVWTLAGSGLLLLVAARLTGQPTRLKGRRSVYYGISGVLSLSIPKAIAFSAVPQVGGAFVSMCLAFPPLLTYMLALQLRMEALQMRRAMGITVGLCGALLLVAGSIQGSEAWHWYVLAALGPIFIACGNIYRSRHWPGDDSPIAIAPGVLLAGACILCAGAAASGVVLIPAMNTAMWRCLMLQIVAFAGTYALYFALQKRAGAVYMSQIGSVGAIAGVLMATLYFSEPFALRHAAAAIAIFTGVYFTTVSRPRH